jgi:hypothetical protein
MFGKGDFTRLNQTDDLCSVLSLNPSQCSAAFMFRIGVSATVCRDDWEDISQEVLSWGVNSGIPVRIASGQAVVVVNDGQSDFENSLFQFILRWC